jgi:phenolic acid decarboxylase
MDKITLIQGYKDININDEVILHINRTDEGYAFDIYAKSLYDTDNYDGGFLAGTWVHDNEIQEMK